MKDGIRAVIVCPTKELAAQTTRECKKLARGNKFRIKLMTKALVRTPDLSKLHCDILISTPLRLRLAVKKRKMDLSRYKTGETYPNLCQNFGAVIMCMLLL